MWENIIDSTTLLRICSICFTDVRLRSISPFHENSSTKGQPDDNYASLFARLLEKTQDVHVFRNRYVLLLATSLTMQLASWKRAKQVVPALVQTTGELKANKWAQLIDIVHAVQKPITLHEDKTNLLCSLDELFDGGNNDHTTKEVLS